jgi:hypothetical protein
LNRENFFLFTPLLHEVAASDLVMTHIVNPIRRFFRHVQFFEGDVESIDLSGRKVVVSHGIKDHYHELHCDHLLITLGLRRTWSSSLRSEPRPRRIRKRKVIRRQDWQKGGCSGEVDGGLAFTL